MTAIQDESRSGGFDTIPAGTGAQIQSEPDRRNVPAAVHHFALRARAANCGPEVLIDGHCNILWHSAGAERLLQPPMPLWIKGGQLRAKQGAAPKTWQSFIENVGDEGERMLLGGTEPGAWVLIRGWSSRFDKQRLVFLKCRPSWPLRDVAASGLSRDFGLTKSECAVLDEFARLAKPLQIAERLGISVSTVRSHLKQIHTKMAINSSVQLIGITRAYTDD